MSAQLSFLPEPAPTPANVKPPPRVRSPAEDALWKEGLASLRTILGQRTPQCRALLGRLVGRCGKRYAELSALIDHAARQRPDEPVSWLMAGAKGIGSTCVVEEPWGLRAWIIQEGAHEGFGPEAWGYDALAEVMHATGFPDQWRGSLDPLRQWCLYRYRPDSVARVIAEQVAGFSGQPVSLRFFDQAVRRKALRWSPDKCDWLAGQS